MKKILFAATVLCMMGCQNKPTNSTPALDPSNMDTSVAPNESFYQYATGGWQAKNPLKPEHSSYNMFNVLNDNNEIRINELFTQMTKENPAKGTVNQKIADLYKLGLDSVRLNQEGAAPIRAELETILSLDDKKQLTPILSVMQMTSSSPLFSFGPEADLKDFCFRLTAHTLHGFFERQVGSGFAVKLRNDVAGANACSRGRGIVDRRDHAYAGDIFGDFNAETAETSMRRFTHVFKAFWVKEA